MENLVELSGGQGSHPGICRLCPGLHNGAAALKRWIFSHHSLLVPRHALPRPLHAGLGHLPRFGQWARVEVTGVHSRAQASQDMACLHLPLEGSMPWMLLSLPPGPQNQQPATHTVAWPTSPVISQPLCLESEDLSWGRGAGFAAFCGKK